MLQGVWAKLINFALFQVAWFSAALYQFSALPVLFLVIALLLYFSPSKIIDGKLALVAIAIGFCVDSGMSYFNILNFGQSYTPIWLICIWVCFALTLNHSMQWLLSIHPAVQFLLGGIFGPLSYLAADGFSALTFVTEPLTNVMIHSVTWGVLMCMFSYCVLLFNDANQQTINSAT